MTAERGDRRPVGRPQEAARRLVLASCKAQGIEPKISNPVVIGRVASMLDSGAPDRLDPLGLETVEAAPTGPDRGVVQNGGDDRPPAGERQVVPGVTEG